MSFWFDRNKDKDRDTISRNSTFIITERGREKLQEFNGDPNSQVFVALETDGSSNIAELSRATRITPGQLERLLPILLRQGYIQDATQSSDFGV